VLAWPNCAKGQARANTDLRVREAPETGAIIGNLSATQAVTVWCVVNGWALIQTTSGLTGWASMAYLTPEGELNP
jgi:hypothetical protein